MSSHRHVLRSHSTLTSHKKRTHLAKRRKPGFEPLEERALMAADLSPLSPLSSAFASSLLAPPAESIDGTGNNPWHRDWGSTGEALLRKSPVAYADGISAMAGADRPSARAVSNALAVQLEEALNDRNMSAFVYAWGQFLDHDIDQTTATSESEPIEVPMGDPWFDPGNTDPTKLKNISFTRSIYDSDPVTGTGTSTANPRQQLNMITAFVDGSQIYGSDAERAAALRAPGGKLLTSQGNMLPYNTMGLANDNPTHQDPTTLYAAGDARANENIELTSMQTLFVREHNRLADKIAVAHPAWTGDQIYQQARKLVIAELQQITYNEFLPALLGPSALAPYRGYNPWVNPGIATEFSTAAFRLGHSMLGADIEFMDNNGEPVHEEVELRNAFFNPALVAETGIDPILKYLASDPAREIDNQVVDDVRNFLFGPPGAGGFDLASLNIQRGRDHGLADYNSVRAAYGLRPVQSFAEITKNVEVQQALQATYGNVNNIDLWVGGLAEDHVAGGSLGPLFRRILVDQFQRLRDGDRYWYERTLNFGELQMVRGTSLANIIARNTTTTNLQENVFFFRTAVSGIVFFDLNKDGSLGFREFGVPGITVNLLDADGNVVDTTTTGYDGRYVFKQMDLGTYRVQVALPGNLRLTTSDTEDIEITKGMSVTGINYGVLGNFLPRLFDPINPWDGNWRRR